MSHFVSLLHCSHCKYVTHCSRAYANHMIRCGWRLRCVSCSFSTRTGDMMANHMTDKAHHTCSIALVYLNDACLEIGSSVFGDVSCSEEKQGQLLSGGGAFIPIHLLTSGTASTQLCVKLLSSPPPPCSSPAMTIRVLGPRLPTAQSGAEPVTRTTASTVKASLGSTVGSSAPGSGVGAVLGPDKLQVVLFALCSGLPQASQRYQMDPAVIQSWILQREQDLEHRTWSWDTEPVAEWVLIQREQQFAVQESSLLQAGAGVLGGVQYGWGGLHGWVVDLMLHHHLSMQCTVQSHDSPLPRPFAHKTLRFLRQLHTQMRTCQPGSVGCMDELSVFSDLAGLKSRPVLQLYGRSESRWCDVVLSGLADGTFLKPALFFKGPQLCLPHDFPDNVLLEARPEGFTDQQRLQLWFNKVWRPHVERGRGFSLLLMDKHRGHEGAEFHAALEGYSTHSAIIPIGCSTHLQPLDICITPSVREFLQARWSQLAEAAGGGLEAEPGGGGWLGLEKLALTLACWLSEVASTLDQMPSVLPRWATMSLVLTVSQRRWTRKREGQVQMIAALAESLIGQQREPIGDEGGDVKSLWAMKQQDSSVWCRVVMAVFYGAILLGLLVVTSAAPAPSTNCTDVVTPLPSSQLDKVSLYGNAPLEAVVTL
ncbi:Pogo transposable element with ZNF domain [Merluccius polli]|uniref:Pogo transposable element with ZNF domain n=1 Tax=Merluccius polli TaxID=89951 RepID=A0AA47MTL3_MERPO|nr:Pogo transposable element with ZNF domain [Merluccius polli]